MSTRIVIDCDPGHDDAIAILLALASPEVELRGVTTVAGNQTIDKTTRNALKVLELAGRSDIPVVRGAEAPLERPLRTAAHVHGESGLEGPDLPEPGAVLTAVKTAARRLRRWPVARVDPGCARRRDEPWPGRGNGARPNRETRSECRDE